MQTNQPFVTYEALKFLLFFLTSKDYVISMPNWELIGQGDDSSAERKEMEESFQQIRRRVTKPKKKIGS